MSSEENWIPDGSDRGEQGLLWTGEFVVVKYGQQGGVQQSGAWILTQSLTMLLRGALSPWF